MSDHGPVEPIPPRGPMVPADKMLLAFDVDCGYLPASHRFIARGITDCGTIPGPTVMDSAPGFSFEYELVPGTPPNGGSSPGPYSVGIEYETDVALPRPTHDTPDAFSRSLRI